MCIKLKDLLVFHLWHAVISLSRIISLNSFIFIIIILAFLWQHVDRFDRFVHKSFVNSWFFFTPIFLSNYQFIKLANYQIIKFLHICHTYIFVCGIYTEQKQPRPLGFFLFTLTFCLASSFTISYIVKARRN